MPELARPMKQLRPEGAFRVLADATALEKQGRNIVHFEIGQPDFPTPKNICDAGISAITEGKTKYVSPVGILPLREKIAEDLSDRGAEVDADNIIVTPSGKTAIFAAMASVLEPGDEVIYPDPGFTYPIVADYLQAEKKPVPLLEETGFSFDMDALRKQFSSKTKLLILNSPSNPTGGIIPKKDLQEIADMVEGTDCWVMPDDMYLSIVYGDKAPSFYGIPEMKERTLLVDGFSKKYRMTGWRIGYLSVPHNIVPQMEYLMTHVVGCTATPTQWAALEALSGSQEPVKEMVDEFRRRRDFVVNELNNIPGVSCIKPEGAFYAFPNVKSFGKSSRKIADHLLQDGGVALLDGTSFGQNGEGYLRISYATGMDNLKEGISRIKSSLARL